MYLLAYLGLFQAHENAVAAWFQSRVQPEIYVGSHWISLHIPTMFLPAVAAACSMRCMVQESRRTGDNNLAGIPIHPLENNTTKNRGPRRLNIPTEESPHPFAASRCRGGLFCRMRGHFQGHRK